MKPPVMLPGRRWKRRDRESNTMGSVRVSAPAARMRLPSGVGTGPERLTGPKLSGEGLGSRQRVERAGVPWAIRLTRRPSPLSPPAHMGASYRRYRRSGVQLAANDWARVVGGRPPSAGMSATQN